MLHKTIEERLQSAVGAVLPDADLNSVQVRPAADPKFGDYQLNAIMNLAKQRKLNPRQVAAQVVERARLEDICEPLEVAGAGFINLRLKPTAIRQVLLEAAEGQHLFTSQAAAPKTIVVDFSSPNVAKPMHVGHIRSTILGDSLTRILRFLGHNVITDNHIGDWGTQFGKLLVGWKRGVDREKLQSDPLGEMERIYKEINQEFEAKDDIKAAARTELVKLQSGDPENLAIWREMIDFSRREFDHIYGRLGVTFDHTFGESFYNPRLKGVVQELQQLGIARESEGATAVFFEDIPELKEQPALIQKSDGGFNYTTTDLATLAYRFETWGPHEIIYVTDARQQLHFKQLFEIFRRWKPAANMQLSHVWFGMILGPDGRPFKTRTGENVKLEDLLDEAEQRALAVVREKNPELSAAEHKEIARAVGIGAIKYSDLLPNRQSDYVFSWEKMLALNGNTAPYLQYACARIRSIFRKASEDGLAATASGQILLTEADELRLAKQLLNFGLTLEGVIGEYRPNYLCNYLYDLAGHFARFYESCPVLKAEESQRSSRLALCALTEKVLAKGLWLLGIEAPQRM